jgi:tRNA(fMet)-specific endonuclease VapC
MMGPYLLDTNIASYLIKGNFPAVSGRLVKVPPALVAISAVTEAELRYEVARRPGATRLRSTVEQFLSRVTVRPWDSGAAQRFGWMRAAFERGGIVMESFDLMIAAHALSLNAVLVTHDRAFSRITELQVEDWTRPA